jgi:hypothetical protein
VAPVLQEVGELDGSFSNFIIHHVHMSANNSAHICAKLACTLMGRGSWLDFDCIPDFPVTSLQADHSGIFCIFHFELPMT